MGLFSWLSKRVKYLCKQVINLVLGLFSWLLKKDKDNSGETQRESSAGVQGVQAGSDTPATPMREVSLTEHVEQCFYWNARCIGVALITKVYLRESGVRRAGFCMLLRDAANLLSRKLHRIMEASSARGAAWLVPSDFTQLVPREPSLEHGHNLELEQYLYNMGEYALAQASGGGNQVPVSTMMAVLERSTEMAIAECLSMLRAAMEEDASDLVSVMLDKPCCYLLALTLYYLMLQSNLRHMEYPNSVIFIPDSSLDPSDEANKTHLRYFDYDVNDSSSYVPVPSQLSLAWMENGDGMIATGHFKLGGMPGTFCRTGDDSQASSLLASVSEIFVKGVCY